jgi:aminoglycoside phosphotransferase (APT) family kinase protein
VDNLEEELGVILGERLDGGTSTATYQADLSGKQVVLRVFTDDYYTDRFLREGIVLRALQASDLVRSPAIVEEWPEYNVRALELIEMEAVPSDFDPNPVLEWLSNQTEGVPYSLQTDLETHLFDLESLHPAYGINYLSILEKHWDCIEWDETPTSLLHGDLHLGNLGICQDQIIVFDWEFATHGPTIYDRAYLNRFHQISSKGQLEWDFLVTAVLTHWYLREQDFSPKLGMQWFEELSRMEKLCV